MLDAKLKNSRFGQDEFLNLMVDEFEKKESRISAFFSFNNPLVVSTDKACIRWHPGFERDPFWA